MKRLFIKLSILMLSISGCIDLSNEGFFFERPSLRLNFQDQTKSHISGIDNFTAITFNNYYYDKHSHNLTIDDNSNEILILHGVPEDQYGVFIFTEHHKAHLDTLKYTITQEAVSLSHDPIKVGDGDYYVRRANTTQVMTLKDLYVLFKVDITGALELSSSNDFVLTLSNVPQEFDFYGDHSHHKLSNIVPELDYDRYNDHITTSFYSNKFCPNEDVIMSLSVKGVSVVRFNISHYLTEVGVDMSDDNIVIPITIDVSAAGNGVRIKDWDHVSLKSEVGI